MRALQIDAYHADLYSALGQVRVTRKPTPLPGPGQVLVRIAAAPCNPSDLAFMQGLYGVKKPLPAVPGWEGAGTVVASGGGLLANWLKGRRVACAGQSAGDGSWAEYYLADARNCVPLRKAVSIEQGASLIVNPLTAWALMSIAKQEGHQGIVQTAAAGQVGRMVFHLGRREGLQLIHIVRSREQEALLKSLGVSTILNSTCDGFADQLKETCRQRKATIGFDAVGGELTGLVLNAMPDQATLLVYGGLSYAPASGIDGRELIFSRKQIRGFWLTDWIRSAGILRVFQAALQIQKAIIKGHLATEVRRKVDLEEAPEAIRAYFDAMTLGKVLIKPGKDSFAE
jgi:NADPH:quinone reductase-like Zn-dependent oxidoreductase